MEPKYTVGQKVSFAQDNYTIKEIDTHRNEIRYYCDSNYNLPLWLPERFINTTSPDKTLFHDRSPHLVVVDNFYKSPEDIRAIALAQNYRPDLRHYKGQRTGERFLWPFLKEQFEKLLRSNIADWLRQPCNGCFQITGFQDPLVWHSDSQSYAAAIYLTPDAPISAGTSFWRDKQHGCRRPPNHMLEMDRFSGFRDEKTCGQATGEIYSEYNILHQDNWELVDRVGAVYNRLVIWDAKLIHSASSYEGLGNEADKARLVQLFFFTI